MPPTLARPVRARPARAGRLVALAAAATGFALAAAAVGLALAAPPARAHAELTGSEPADGGTVTEPPGEIRLRFDEPVEPAEVRVTGPEGSELAAGEPRADGGVVTQAAHQPVRAGGHTVRYRVVSADGHSQPGEFVFTYTGPTAEPPAPGADSGAGLADRWPLAALAAAAVVVGLLGTLAWRRLARAANGDGAPAGPRDRPGTRSGA